MLSRSILKRTSLLSSSLRAFSSVSKPTVDAFQQSDKDVYLVTGAGGQIGKKICEVLSQEIGKDRLVTTDLADSKPDDVADSTYYQLSVTDNEKYEHIIATHKVTKILHLAAIISALGEKPGNFEMAYDVNVTGSLNTFQLARKYGCSVFLPTSIACFGGEAYQKDNTPVNSILQPETIYGVSKVFNENLGAYFHKKFGLDFRNLRYPGVISSQKFAFNGTVSYPTEVFFEALEKGHYDCYLEPDTQIPVIYCDETIDATLRLVRAPRENLKRCTYNLAGIPMTPRIFFKEVEKLIPGTTFGYKVDPLRQAIGESWPNSLDESTSIEYGWTHDITPYELAKKILVNIDDKYKQGKNLNLQ